MHARWAENAERALHKIVTRIWRADDGQIVASFGYRFHSNLHMNRLGGLDARVQHSDQAMLFFNSREQLAELRLVCKLRSPHNLGCAFHVDLASLILPEHRWVPQS